MKKSVFLLIASFAFVIWATAQGPVKSSGLHVYQASGYVHHNTPSTHKAPKARGNTVSIASSLRKLKAVLIVGPVESDVDATTKEYIEDLKMAAAVLRANNVDVIEYYTPNNNWQDIAKSAEGAHIIIYKGHGVYDGSEPPKWVGGFCLKESFPSSQDIVNDMKLAPNALVLISGCFTAGNAGSDIGKIKQAEAERRVAMYSKPFFDIGAACYYANWYGTAFQDFLQNLFAGKTFGEAYRSYPNGNNPAKIVDLSYPHQGRYKMHIGSEQYGSDTAYNNAFIGDESKTLLDFFKE